MSPASTIGRKPMTRQYVACIDFARRPRTVTTSVDVEGRVTLTTPPGEPADLTPEAARELAGQLTWQADAAEDAVAARSAPLVLDRRVLSFYRR